MEDSESTAVLEVTSLLDGEGLDEDTLVEALADDRRREVLSYVVRAEGSLTVDELATTLAATDRSRPPVAGDADRVGIRLYHVHLPKLAKVGLIEVEDDYNRVTSTEIGECFHSLFRDCQLDLL